MLWLWGSVEPLHKLMAVKEQMVPTFSSTLCAHKPFYSYVIPIYTVTIGLCVVMAC